MSDELTKYQNEVEVIDSARNDVLGAEVTTTDYKLPPDWVKSASLPDEFTLEHVVRKLKGKAETLRYSRITGDGAGGAAAWPTLTSQEEEPQTGKKISVVRTFNASEPDIGVNGTARVVESVEPINNRLWLTTTRTIDPTIIDDGGAPAVPTVFTEYHSVDYYFPGYLDDTTPFHVIALGHDAAINPNRSGDHSFKIPARFEITYHTSAPVAAEVFQFKTVDIQLLTPRFNLNQQNIITDGGTMNAVMYGNEVVANALQQVAATLSFEWPASSPTTTEYKAMMGTEKLVAEDSSRWKFNLWRRVKVYMEIPDLTLGLSGSLIY